MKQAKLDVQEALNNVPLAVIHIKAYRLSAQYFYDPHRKHSRYF